MVSLPNEEISGESLLSSIERSPHLVIWDGIFLSMVDPTCLWQRGLGLKDG